jgi:hypothetical protein
VCHAISQTPAHLPRQVGVKHQFGGLPVDHGHQPRAVCTVLQGDPDADADANAKADDRAAADPDAPDLGDPLNP